jgi:hypothetical protein
MHDWQGGATEDFGSLGHGLTFAPSGITALPTFLGAQVDAEWKPPENVVFNPFVRLAWMHDFLPNRDVTRSFAELPGLSFSSTGTPTVSNAAALRAGMQYKLGERVSLSASVETELSASYRSFGGSFGLQWTWQALWRDDGPAPAGAVDRHLGATRSAGSGFLGCRLTDREEYIRGSRPRPYGQGNLNISTSSASSFASQSTNVMIDREYRLARGKTSQWPV